MFPEPDQFLKVGENLHLNCTMIANTALADTVFDISRMEFILPSQAPARTNMMVYPAENTLSVSVWNVSIEDAGFYMCYYKDGYQNMSKVNVGG